MLYKRQYLHLILSIGIVCLYSCFTPKISNYDIGILNNPSINIREYQYHTIFSSDSTLSNPALAYRCYNYYYDQQNQLTASVSYKNNIIRDSVCYFYNPKLEVFRIRQYIFNCEVDYDSTHDSLPFLYGDVFYRKTKKGFFIDIVKHNINTRLLFAPFRVFLNDSIRLKDNTHLLFNEFLDIYSAISIAKSVRKNTAISNKDTTYSVFMTFDNIMLRNILHDYVTENDHELLKNLEVKYDSKNTIISERYVCDSFIVKRLYGYENNNLIFQKMYYCHSGKGNELIRLRKFEYYLLPNYK